jgi:hypothetical protein
LDHNLNCGDHQFHQYPQNEQSSLILDKLTEHTKITTHDVWNPGRGLGQAKKGVGLNRLMESHSCWNDSDACLIISWFCLLSHVIPIDFWYWFDYLAYIYFDYQVIPKSIFIYHPDTIFCKKKHIPRGTKLKRYAKFY